MAAVKIAGVIDAAVNRIEQWIIVGRVELSFDHRLVRFHGFKNGPDPLGDAAQ